jgi:hypothetical protein
MTSVSALIPMPIVYERDDRRRLITVTVTEPYSLDDIRGVIDRQAGEDTWWYAMLYDLRAVTDTSAEADLQQIADRVQAVGDGRARGPVGIAIRPRPALFVAGMMYTKLTKGLMTVEVLLTPKQIDAWLARNAPSSSRQP